MGHKKGIDEAICSEFLDTKLRALSPISQHSTRLEVTKASATHLWRSSNCHTPEDDEAIHASSQHLICQSEHGDQLNDTGEATSKLRWCVYSTHNNVKLELFFVVQIT